MNILQELQGVAYIAVAFLFLYICKKVQDSLCKEHFDPDFELEENSNLAFGFRRAGLYLGTALAMFGAISGPSKGLEKDLIILAIDGAFISLALGFSKIIVDRVILPTINNAIAIRENNIAVGLVEMGAFIATGLVAMGSFTGESVTIGSGLISAVLFFCLGQGVLTIGSKIIQLSTKFDIIREVKKSNTAAGTLMCGGLVAQGIILNQALTGSSPTILAGIISFAIAAIKGIAVLFVFQWVADKLFLPNTTIQIEVERDRNVAAMVVTASVMIAVSLIVVASVV